MAQQGSIGNDLPDHRRLCWIEVRIGYAAPNPAPKRRDELWERRIHAVPRLQLPVTYPTTRAEQDAVVVAAFQAVARELRRKPLGTVRP